MKRILAPAVLFVLCLAPAAAQTPTPQSKLSMHLRMLVSGDPVVVEQARRSLLIRTGPQHPQPAVGVFIRFEGDPAALQSALTTYGAGLKTVVGNRATAEIPIQSLDQVAALPAILEIEESRASKPTLDVSVPATGANQLWYSGNGPVAVGSTNRGPMPPPWEGNTGKNAIVGIVDTGIDLSHKDFIDLNGKSRILALWDQTVTGTKPATPAGYSTFNGNECTNAQIDAVRRKSDLMMTNPFTGTMSYLIGGNGFGSTGSFTKGHNAASVALADFDLDGHVDAITGNLDGTISWVQNQGASFVPQSPITVAASSNTQVTAIAAADLNHDGKPDVVAVLYQSNQVAILLGKGDGTFQAPVTIGVGANPDSVAVLDADLDGNYDLVIGNYSDGTLTVLLGDGKGGFVQAPGSPFPVSTAGYNANTEAGATPSYIVSGDFNGDGKPDLAVADFGRGGAGLPGADLSIILGNGDGTFGTPTSINLQRFAMSLVAADFNRDGNLDLAVVGYSNSLFVLLGQGDGTFGNPTSYPAGGTVGLYHGQATIVAGDFNGDGLLDIAQLVRSSTQNGSFYDQVAVFNGNGDGTFGAATLYTSDPGGNSSYMAVGSVFNSVCSETDVNGHGTNVAGIAAGNGAAGGTGVQQTPYRYVGMAPEAGIIFVKTTFQTQDIVDAIAYIENKAFSMGKSVAINLSLGSSIGSHDGTGNYEAMVSGLASTGYIVVAAMGNEQSDALHVAGALADGGSQTMPFSMPAGKTDTAFVDLWYRGSDQFGVSLSSPAGVCMASPIFPGNASTPPATISSANCGTLTVYNSGINANNSDRDFYVEITNGANPIPPGNWSITVTGKGCAASPCVVDGRFDIWTDPMPFTTPAVTPFFTIDSPATATNVIAVGSYVTKTSWFSPVSAGNPTQGGGVLGKLSSFSSLGPMRSCSNPVCFALPQKPDIAAPGETILSAYAAGTLTNSCNPAKGVCLDPDGQHIAYQGTSMATPHVTGAVALMLSQNANQSPCQVKTGLTHARTDAFTGNVPNNLWGYGKLAVDQAITVQTPNYTVPNVTGMTQAAAQAAIVAAHLSVGAINMMGSNTVPRGSVISQNPTSGNWSGAVNLIVASGLQSITVTPANPSILLGTNQLFKATGNYSDNTTQDLTDQVAWTSSTAATATIAGDGTATVVAVGTTTISAAFDGLTGSTLLTVKASKCDADGDGHVTAADVQHLLAEALGTAPAVDDLNGDGVVNNLDVQIVIKAALGLGCSAH